MRRWVCRARVVILLSLLTSLVSSPATGDTKEPIADSLARGLSYLVDTWQGDAYDDAYLQFLYANERLECPLEGCRLTYRLLDAYINLAFLERAEVDPGPAEEQFLRAQEVLAAIVPLWREHGLYNVKRAPQDDGFALDTYCIVGLLVEDAKMARVVAGHLDGDDWLGDDLYEPIQSFRKLADESWCVSLLAVAGEDPALVDRLARVQVARARDRLAESQAAEARANIALHMVYLLTRVARPTFDEDLAYFVEELARVAQDPALEDDLLTQANILEALARCDRGERSRLSKIAEMLIGNQESDGGWHSRVGERGSSLRVFTTLRALLALSRYRDLSVVCVGDD